MERVDAEIIVVGHRIQVRNPPDALLKAFEEIDVGKSLKRGSNEQLRRLLKAGCQYEKLIRCLLLIRQSRNLDTWKNLIGYSEPRKLTSVCNRLRRCAKEVETVNASVMGRVLMHMGMSAAKHYPDLLRSIADTYDVLPQIAPPHKNLTLTAAKRQMVEYVIEATGHPHYGEVSKLIAAVLGIRYDANAHRVWCQKHGLAKPSTSRRRVSRAKSNL